MSDVDGVDWQSLMRFGLGVLGIAPQDFWNMTPPELTAAAEGRFGPASNSPSLDRTAFEDLARQFPDDDLSPKGAA